MFENGSGDVLVARRVAAFAVCATRLVPPASNATIMVNAGLGWRANDSVDRVPGRIEPWNFVGEKFQGIEDARDCDDPRVPEDLERLILRRKDDPVEMDGKSSGENR